MLSMWKSDFATPSQFCKNSSYRRSPCACDLSVFSPLKGIYASKICRRKIGGLCQLIANTYIRTILNSQNSAKLNFVL